MIRNGKKSPGKRNDRTKGWRQIRNIESGTGLVFPKDIESDYRKKYIKCSLRLDHRGFRPSG